MFPEKGMHPLSCLRSTVHAYCMYVYVSRMGSVYLKHITLNKDLRRVKKNISLSSLFKKNDAAGRLFYIYYIYIQIAG